MILSQLSTNKALVLNTVYLFRVDESVPLGGALDIQYRTRQPENFSADKYGAYGQMISSAISDDVGEFFTLAENPPEWAKRARTIQHPVFSNGVFLAGASRKVSSSFLRPSLIHGEQRLRDLMDNTDGTPCSFNSNFDIKLHVYTVAYYQGECQFVLVNPETTSYTLTFASNDEPARALLSCYWQRTDELKGTLTIVGPEMQLVTLDVETTKISVRHSTGLLPATDSGCHFLIGNINGLLEAWFFARKRELEKLYGMR